MSNIKLQYRDKKNKKISAGWQKEETPQPLKAKEATMYFSEFMEMVAVEIKKHKDVLAEKKTNMAAQRAATSWEEGGLRCCVYLKENGEISAEQTGISVQFTALPLDS